MLILAVDSSAKTASCALCEDGRILGSFFLDNGLVHSRTLMPLVRGLLEQTGRSLKEIGLFAVSAGPGSFTGIRIGVAAVKGMALPLGAPCAAVSPLDAMAENLRHLPCATVCAVMDARRDQVYNAVYDARDGVLTKRAPDRAICVDALLDEMKNEEICVFYIGDGADLCYNRSLERGIPARLSPPQLKTQNAAGVAAAALGIARRGGTVSAQALCPVYLRLPQAEREYRERAQAADKPSADTNRQTT